ncbi:MAG: bifunctional adenosylcobinamide kinase/adenosylcobinamide-phosphate guanylyltransferase [Deltaproteobacteria bacterium]|nr:bifunctional adenosylcobinamide kinase/adenosylcobinamide-phosphate guanylyltransferase [Deltaproteobacteria bacterium]
MTKNPTTSILVGGGARSGKSSFAQKMAEGLPGRRVYLATAQALDREMEQRIAKHQADRGSTWHATLEEPLNLTDCLQQAGADFDIILVDCITLWLSNLMGRNDQDQQILKEIDKLAAALNGLPATVILVSNEVGLGLVPEHPLGRRFRDLAGLANQRLAQACQEVYFTMWGLPQKLK